MYTKILLYSTDEYQRFVALKSITACHYSIWFPQTPAEMVGRAILGANLSAFDKAIGFPNSYPLYIDFNIQ